MNYVYCNSAHAKILNDLQIDSVVSFQTFVEDIYSDALVVQDSTCSDSLKYKVLTPLNGEEGYLINFERTNYLKFLYSVYVHLVTIEKHRPLLYFYADINQEQFKTLMNTLCKSNYINKFLGLRDLNNDTYKFISATSKTLAFNFASVVVKRLDSDITSVPLNVASVLFCTHKEKLIRAYNTTKHRYASLDLYAPFLSL